MNPAGDCPQSSAVALLQIPQNILFPRVEKGLPQPLFQVHGNHAMYATTSHPYPFKTLPGAWPEAHGRTRTGLARLLVLVLFLCCAVGLSGCSLTGSGGSEPTAGGKGGKRGTKPYTIRGKTYYPLISADNFREEGIASWYGKDFHGKSTANGERYDMYGMTAAHKLLPFNTKVRVTNKSNGKSIVVRINDRGPFVSNRVIDLTRTGADQLGMLGPGTAPVLIENVGSVPGLKNGDISGKFYVQVGAFSSKANADGLVARLQGRGSGARSAHAPDVGFWRVQVGPYPSLKHAEEAATSMSGEFPNNFVVAD